MQCNLEKENMCKSLTPNVYIRTSRIRKVNYVTIFRSIKRSLLKRKEEFEESTADFLE